MSFQLPNAEGYIFDFNGTLFWDSDENREAWSMTFSRYRGTPITDEEFRLLNGRTDEETVFFLAPDKSSEEREAIAAYKESLYKELCIRKKLKLSPGAEKLLSYLSERKIPIAIASSAPRINMDWYIPEYGLTRFFAPSNIIAGRTDIPSKPDPAIFLLAASALGLRPEETIIFEDSESGVKGALASGAKSVIRIKEPGCSSITDPRVTEIDSFEDIITEER